MRTGYILAYLPLSLMEGQSEWENKGAACASASGQVGIGWLKHPLKGWLHLGTGHQRTPAEDGAT